MAISKRLRFEVLRRDNHCCRYCGRKAPEIPLTVDHVVPTTLGGSDDPANLVAACKDCNSGKSSVPADAAMVDDVASDAMRWAAALRQAAEIRAASIAENRDHMGWFNMIWFDWTDGQGRPFDGPDHWYRIPEFIAAGLSRGDLKHALEISMRSHADDKWAYFCGVCWRMIRESQEIARQIIASEGV